MARRSDRGSSPKSRPSRRYQQRPSGSPSRSGQWEAERPRTRSHGSSRPASAAHQGGYGRQDRGRAPLPARSRSRQRLEARQAERQQGSFRANRGGKGSHSSDDAGFASKSVGELRRADRIARAKESSRRRFMRIGAIAAVAVALVAGGFALYHSPLFAITNVSVNGVEHLTSDEMAQLANVPKDSTLLRVDADTIEKRVEQNAWVADAQVNRVFPNTLEINVTERSVYAVVEVPTSSAISVKQWAIAADHVWLMPIPDAGSEAAKTTSAKVYEDAANALRIVDVPFGTKAEIGEICSDSNINNALDIVSGLTTELAGRIAEVSAAGTAETTLVLDNGVEVAFGKAEDIRDKERVILQILEENEDNVAYINVRMVETPTWRAV